MRSQPQLAPCRELREAQPGQLTGQPPCVLRERAVVRTPYRTSMCAVLSVSERTASPGTALDYADTASPVTPATSGGRLHIGITTVSG